LVDEDSSNSEVLTSVDSSDNDSIINNTNSTTKDQSAYSDATHTDTDHILDLTTTHVKDESTHLDDKIDLSEKNSDSSKDVTLEMLEKLEILSDDQKKLFDKLYYPYKLQSLKDS
jgi:hypothetical protein